MSTAIIPGSLQAVAASSGQSLAESFLAADAIVLIDTSGSMHETDVQTEAGYRRRFTVACDELTRLQCELPGKIAVIQFSTEVRFCPGGLPIFDGGCTNLASALAFVRPADGTGIKIIIISDGEPSEPDRCIALARSFQTSLDTIYIGPSGGIGAVFLERLARASGGTYAARQIPQLASAVKGLLNAA